MLKALQRVRQNSLSQPILSTNIPENPVNPIDRRALRRSVAAVCGASIHHLHVKGLSMNKLLTALIAGLFAAGAFAQQAPAAPAPVAAPEAAAAAPAPAPTASKMATKKTPKAHKKVAKKKAHKHAAKAA
jgi:hypothetical protein